MTDQPDKPYAKLLTREQRRVVDDLRANSRECGPSWTSTHIRENVLPIIDHLTTLAANRGKTIEQLQTKVNEYRTESDKNIRYCDELAAKLAEAEKERDDAKRQLKMFAGEILELKYQMSHPEPTTPPEWGKLREMLDKLHAGSIAGTHNMELWGEFRACLAAQQAKGRKVVEMLETELYDRRHEVWCQQTISAARLAFGLDAAEAKEPQHVCGLSGYNGMIDPPCPACEQSWKEYEALKIAKATEAVPAPAGPPTSRPKITKVGRVWPQGNKEFYAQGWQFAGDTRDMWVGHHPIDKPWHGYTFSELARRCVLENPTAGDEFKGLDGCVWRITLVNHDKTCMFHNITDNYNWGYADPSLRENSRWTAFRPVAPKASILPGTPHGWTHDAEGCHNNEVTTEQLSHHVAWHQHKTNPLSFPAKGGAQ